MHRKLRGLCVGLILALPALPQAPEPGQGSPEWLAEKDLQRLGREATRKMALQKLQKAVGDATRKEDLEDALRYYARAYDLPTNLAELRGVHELSVGTNVMGSKNQLDERFGNERTLLYALSLLREFEKLEKPSSAAPGPPTASPSATPKPSVNPPPAPQGTPWIRDKAAQKLAEGYLDLIVHPGELREPWVKQSRTTDFDTQKMGSAEGVPDDKEDIMGEVDEVTVISGAPSFFPVLARAGWDALARSLALPTRLSVGAAPQSSSAPVLMTFTSLGVSSGESFEVQLVNNGTRPVRIDNLSLALEPLTREAGRSVQQEMQRLAAGKLRKFKLNAYCLEFLRKPPVAGTVFRIAAAEQQARFAPMRTVFRASRQLLREGQLKPDSERKAYFHSIRQWAIWTTEQRFDQKRFEQAFVDHTRKNLEAGGRQWNAEFDKALRGAIPHRWQQVQLVLRTAEAMK